MTDIKESKLCDECENYFALDELIQLEGDYVCASCKAIKVQQIREGVPKKIIADRIQSNFNQLEGTKYLSMFILGCVLFYTCFLISLNALGPAITNESAFFIILFCFLSFLGYISVLAMARKINRKYISLKAFLVAVLSKSATVSLAFIFDLEFFDLVLAFPLSAAALSFMMNLNFDFRESK